MSIASYAFVVVLVFTGPKGNTITEEYVTSYHSTMMDCQNELTVYNNWNPPPKKNIIAQQAYCKSESSPSKMSQKIPDRFR